MNTQIPIFGAYTFEGEWVEGALLPSDNRLCISTSKQLWITEDDGSRFRSYYASLVFEIDPETLSIHFPDMLDKNGDCIFAALNESGVGGSIIHVSDDVESPVIFAEGSVWILTSSHVDDTIELFPIIDCVEVTGFYEGATK